MILTRPPGSISLALTSASLSLAWISMWMGRRVNYLERLPLFNTLAAVMLSLAGAGLVIACLAIARGRGSASLWVAAVLAASLIALLLVDD